MALIEPLPYILINVKFFVQCGITLPIMTLFRPIQNFLLFPLKWFTHFKCTNVYLLFLLFLVIGFLSLYHVTFGGGWPRTLHTSRTGFPSCTVMFLDIETIVACCPENRGKIKEKLAQTQYISKFKQFLKLGQGHQVSKYSKHFIYFWSKKNYDQFKVQWTLLSVFGFQSIKK